VESHIRLGGYLIGISSAVHSGGFYTNEKCLTCNYGNGEGTGGCVGIPVKTNKTYKGN
jgi:hypothetical protein